MTQKELLGIKYILFNILSLIRISRRLLKHCYLVTVSLHGHIIITGTCHILRKHNTFFFSHREDKHILGSLFYARSGGYNVIIWNGCGEYAQSYSVSLGGVNGVECNRVSTE